MLRKFLNSKVIVTTNNERTIDDGEVYFIQSERLSDNTMIVEYVNQDDLCELIPFGVSTPAVINNNAIVSNNEKAEEYKQVILNKDPYGKYSGQPLSAPFENKDINWIENVIKNMRNDYIKKRVEYLAEYYGLR